MPDVDFRYLLLGCLAIALLVAVVTDLKRRQIDNWLNATIAAGAPLYWWASGLSLWPGVAMQIGVAVLVFGLFALIFARGGMGGGDVKLLIALALWLPPLVFFIVLFLTSLVGGAMSVMAGARNLSLGEGQRFKRLIAISGAFLWVLGSCYAAWVISGGTRISAPAWLPSAAFKAALVVLFGIVLSGGLIVSRNQKSRLKIPYGLAISTGGLLVVAQFFVPLVRGTLPSGPIG
jgi:prepilin peptidase CpaA